MALLLPAVLALLAACSAATDTLSPGDVLAGNATLLSNNSKFALGFFRAPDPDTAAPAPDPWYLGIWFTAVPGRTTVWAANAGSPVATATTSSPELTISAAGDLVVTNHATKAITWSSANSSQTTATNATTVAAVLLNSGNLVLLDAANSSSAPRTVWQSFDHPTDTLLPGAKLGRDKAAGVTSRLVSRRSAATPSPGPYCFEVDPAAPQLVLKLCNSSSSYWATGAWNGRFFVNIPELMGNIPGFSLAFVDDGDEEYLQYNVTNEATVTRNIVDVTGQNKHQVWVGKSWLTLYAAPKSMCDVYAACGGFAVCSYAAAAAAQPCGCMMGFSVRSEREWEQGDRTGGCARDAPMDCNSNSSGSVVSSTDGFFAMPGIELPDRGHGLVDVRSLDECSTACLKNCSCTAYSYGSQGCLVWQGELVNAKQPESNGTNSVPDEILYLRLAASEFQTSGGKKRGVIIGVVTGACTAALILLVLFIILMIRRKKSKNRSIQAGDARLVAFSYRELRSATKNFSEKLGQGGFGSVFRGQLGDSTAVAVKRLDGSFQGEKQFRAEVSSIGVIQHINLVRLLGFCCEGEHRLLVYEHVPNRSLDIHLFQSAGGGRGGVFLDWATRYQIAVGVARGLAYLHDGCRERIIHCDVKPENILLDAALLPKIADFGMAKFVGRDFSRVLTTMRGTKGYLAPEWIGGAAVTPKVDVYGYGLVLLELVSGKRNSSAGEQRSDTDTTGSDGGGGGGGREVYFPMKAARELIIGGDVRTLLDERLHGGGDVNLKEVERACKVACWCIQDDEADRPTMGEVVQMLEGVIDREMPPLPRLLETIFGRPHSSTQQMTTGSSTSVTFTSGSGSSQN
ncbi:unnamed protein product [Urochloa humidicola]